MVSNILAYRYTPPHGCLCVAPGVGEETAEKLACTVCRSVSGILTVHETIDQ